MKPQSCDDVRDLLPEFAAGTLAGEETGWVEDHLSACEACAEELRLVSRVLDDKPEAPPGLRDAITARIRADGLTQADDVGQVLPMRSPRRRWTPAWGLSAAALVAVSLGIGVVWSQFGGDGEVPLEVSLQEPLPEAWLWDDGIVAGGLNLDGLTDEELEALLEELEG
jgi:anti-sigma factor RsiW